jgi:hypothetical protein
MRKVSLYKHGDLGKCTYMIDARPIMAGIIGKKADSRVTENKMSHLRLIKGSGHLD